MNLLRRISGCSVSLLFVTFILYSREPLMAGDRSFNSDGIKVINFDNGENSSSKKSKKNTGRTKSGYSIEETTELMSSSDIGNLKLDHDDHVYKCMKIAKMGKDLKGAFEALVAFETDFGDTLDEDEVDLFIQLSLLDTKLFKRIAGAADDIGKDKATIQENKLIVNVLKQGKGDAFLKGLELADKCSYDIENEFLSRDRVDLFIKLGMVKESKRFMRIYDAMVDAGMDSDVRDKGLEFLYGLYKLDGDVAGKITNYLEKNSWQSREQPGDREFQVIKDLMKGDFSPFYKKRGGYSYDISDRNYRQSAKSPKHVLVEVKETEPDSGKEPVKEENKAQPPEEKQNIHPAEIENLSLAETANITDNTEWLKDGKRDSSSKHHGFSGFVLEHFIGIALLFMFLYGIFFLIVFHKNAILRHMGISRSAR